MQLHRLLWMDRLAGSIRQLGPYAALELALPGGSVIALALWAARHHPMATVCWRRALALMIAVVAVFATAQPAFGNSGSDSVSLEQRSCGITSAEEARSFGDLLYEQGEYQRAAECYLSAGEHSLADAAFFKAAVPAGTDTSHRLAENREEVKAQLRKMKEILRRQP
jgi:hypothetical protein